MSTPSYFCLCLNGRAALVHSAAPVIQEATFLFLGKIYVVVDCPKTAWRTIDKEAKVLSKDLRRLIIIL